MSVESMAIVLHHSKATGSDKVILLGIANHDGDGGAWPSIKTLTTYSNTTESAVQRSLRRLEQMGEIRCHVQAGGNADTRNDHRPNRYEVLVQCPPECDRTKNHKIPDGVAPARPGEANGVASTPPRGSVHASHGVAPTRPEPSLNHPEPKNTSSPSDDPSFEAFWNAYPRKIGKGEARKAWASALRRGVQAPDVIAAAYRYADQTTRARTETRFIKHPGPWLNAERYADEPEAAAPAEYTSWSHGD